jgi:hypothetical protein
MLDSDMTEQGHNNLSAGAFEEAVQLDDEFIPADAWPVCPKCLSPCHPLQYYCHNCDSSEAINPLASYMPFVRIRFNIGMFCKMWRRKWYDKEASIIFRLLCWFVIILFTLIFLMRLPI